LLGDEHPFATYFDVHQGYMVLTYSHLPTKSGDFQQLCVCLPEGMSENVGKNLKNLTVDQPRRFPSSTVDRSGSGRRCDNLPSSWGKKKNVIMW